MEILDFPWKFSHFLDFRLIFLRKGVDCRPVSCRHITRGQYLRCIGIWMPQMILQQVYLATHIIMYISCYSMVYSSKLASWLLVLQPRLSGKGCRNKASGFVLVFINTAHNLEQYILYLTQCKVFGVRHSGRSHRASTWQMVYVYELVRGAWDRNVPRPPALGWKLAGVQCRWILVECWSSLCFS